METEFVHRHAEFISASHCCWSKIPFGSAQGTNIIYRFERLPVVVSRERLVEHPMSFPHFGYAQHKFQRESIHLLVDSASLFDFAQHKLRQESILLFPFVMLNLVQHLILVGFKPYENLKPAFAGRQASSG
ncbi:hypothetical protein [Flagellimonas ruestringensis]|uniref:hypothetical protein n=1 Tax=Flagellimonas ruestringensis TaxID=111501 RepID=UPI0011D2B434|nr:hypothetical protein [Allomuricauda ruestringensis]